MDKDEFLSEQTVTKDLALDAWDRADGDPIEAQRLLTPNLLNVKGILSNDRSSINGVFYIKWHYQNSELKTIRAAVTPSSISNVSPHSRLGTFLEELNVIKESPDIMSGYTEELIEALEKLWRESSNEFINIESESNSKMIEAHEKAVEEFLGLSQSNVDLDIDVQRVLDREEPDSESKTGDGAPEQDIWVPDCEVVVTPVKGASVELLEEGDLIYAELGNISEDWEWSPLIPVLENSENESGLVPVTINSITQKANDRFELVLEFADRVKAKTNCPSDVTLKAPQKTLNKYTGENEASGTNQIGEEFIVLGTLVIIVVILLVIYMVTY